MHNVCFSLRIALTGIYRKSKNSVLLSLGFLTVGLIVIASTVSLQMLSSPQTIQFPHPERVVHLYFEDNHIFQMLDAFDSEEVESRASARTRRVQLFANGKSYISQVVMLREEYRNLSMAIPAIGEVVTNQYTMQKLGISDGDSIRIDGEPYMVVYNPSLSMDDAGATLLSNSTYGSGGYIYTFLLKPGDSMAEFLRNLTSHLNTPISPFYFGSGYHKTFYITASEREELTKKDIRSALNMLLSVNVVIYLYLVSQMINIARYILYKEHTKYAIIRLFAGQKWSSFLFCLEILPSALIGLILAIIVMYVYFIHPFSGINGIQDLPINSFLYAIPISLLGALLLERMAFRRFREQSIISLLRSDFV